MPEIFDWKYYLNVNKDVRKSKYGNKKNAELHFKKHGQKEGRAYRYVPEDFYLNKNKEICVVTSFSKKCLEDYAYNFLQSYCLPFDLLIYSEDDISQDISTYNNKNNKIIFENILQDKEYANFISEDGPKEFDSRRNLNKCNSTCDEYCFEHVNRLCKRNGCKNRTISCSGKCVTCNGGYEKIWNETKKFSYKVFSMINSTKKYSKKYKYFIWMDADNVFKEQFDFDLIEKITKNKSFFMAYLGRWNTYLEAGFLLFNNHNKSSKKFFSALRKLYLSNDIYYEQQVHDAFIWNLMKNRFEKKYGKKFKNIDISNNWSKKNNDGGNINIMSRTLLSKYMFHNKGRLKYKKTSQKQNDFKKKKIN